MRSARLLHRNGCCQIDTFQQAYPEIDIRLDTNLEPVDFAQHGIDIAVRYGQGNWSGLVAEKTHG